MHSNKRVEPCMRSHAMHLPAIFPPLTERGNRGSILQEWVRFVSSSPGVVHNDPSSSFTAKNRRCSLDRKVTPPYADTRFSQSVHDPLDVVV